MKEVILLEKYINIAVIVSGIDEYYQSCILEGIQKYAREHRINLAHFIAFGGIMEDSKHDAGEYNIFSLPDFSQFDGAILLANTISSSYVADSIISRIKNAGIPAVSIDRDIPEFYHIGIDNSSAMEKIAEHFIVHHKFRTFNYISGPQNNPESVQRYRAFRNVLEKYSLPFDERRVYFGDFRAMSGRQASEYFLESGLPLPDAVISANDVMALSAMNVFEENNIKIPDDVCFSGFDNTYDARNYSPELTSVQRPLAESGILSCKLLFEHINGKKNERSFILDMKPRFTQSCGCESYNPETPESFKKRNYKKIESNSVSRSMINRMSCKLIDCDSFEEYIEKLKPFINEIKAEEFYLCLCDNWNSDIDDSDNYNFHLNNNFTVEGYTKNVTVPCLFRNGRFSSLESFESKYMVPDMFSSTDKNKIYYFVPLHFRERCLGYLAIMNSDFPMKTSMFQTWSITICSSLENIRKIGCLDNAVKKLNCLYTVDTLSGIYNRNGFKNDSSELFSYCINNHLPVMLMFIDMDNLKHINDNYGHKSGDSAIHAIAEAIKKSCTNGEIYCRFGGDEFIVFGAEYSEEDAVILTEKIHRNIKAESDRLNQEYTLTASIGHYIQIPDENSQIFQFVTVADHVMYEQKKKKKQSKYIKK